MNELWFVSLIFFGCITTVIGVYMGAYVQNYYTQRELLREHHRMTLDLMKELGDEL